MFDEYSVFKYYQFLLTDLKGITRVYTLTENEFEDKKDLINWLDYLVSTGQWITFELYHDLFGISESMYSGIENIEQLQVKHIETVHKCTDVDLDSI